MFRMLLLILSVFCLGLGAENRLPIGQEKGDGQLFNFSSAKLGPDGLIYVFDRGDAFFKVYSQQGTFIRRFGGKGEGPGEVKRAAVVFSFSRDGKSLIWTEFYGGHRWLTIYPLAANKARVISIDYEKNRQVGFWGAEELPDGGYLVQAFLLNSPEQRGDCFYYSRQETLLRINASGQVLATFQNISQPSELSFSNDGGTVTLPFVPEYRWALTGTKTLLFGDGLSAKILRFGVNGEASGELILDLPAAKPVSNEILNQWREELRRRFTSRDKDWYERFGRVIDRYRKSLYDTIPIYDSFSLTPEGNFLLRSYSWRQGEPAEYWLFSPSGKRLAQLQIGGMIHDLSERWLLFSQLDDEEETGLYLLPRTGSEVEDLRRLGE